MKIRARSLAMGLRMALACTAACAVDPVVDDDASATEEADIQAKPSVVGWFRRAREEDGGLRYAKLEPDGTFTAGDARGGNAMIGVNGTWSVERRETGYVLALKGAGFERELDVVRRTDPMGPLVLRERTAPDSYAPITTLVPAHFRYRCKPSSRTNERVDGEFIDTVTVTPILSGRYAVDVRLIRQRREAQPSRVTTDAVDVRAQDGGSLFVQWSQAEDARDGVDGEVSIEGVHDEHGRLPLTGRAGRKYRATIVAKPKSGSEVRLEGATCTLERPTDPVFNEGR
jgi:hypothetical protein